MSLMYKFDRPLYLGASVRNPGWIRIRLRMNRFVPHAFLILLAHGDDQLEIISTEVLSQPWYRKQTHYVIGMAHTYPEAIEIIRKITKECVTLNGDADLKKYLRDRRNRYMNEVQKEN